MREANRGKARQAQDPEVLSRRASSGPRSALATPTRARAPARRRRRGFLLRACAHAAVLVVVNAAAPAGPGGGTVGESAKSAEVSGRGLRDTRELSGKELIPGILPARTSKMENIGGKTGAYCRGSVRGNFLRPRRTGCACGPRAGACAVTQRRWRLSLGTNPGRGRKCTLESVRKPLAFCSSPFQPLSSHPIWFQLQLPFGWQSSCLSATIC